MKQSFSSRLPGLLITALLTVALTLFMAILVQTKLLPSKLLLLAGGIFLLFVFSVCMLTRNSNHTGSMIAGSLMSVVVLVVLMVGTPYLTKAVNALGNMTGVNVEVADVGVYVKQDSSIQQLSELTDKNIGVLEVLDRENSDKVVEDLLDEVGTLNVEYYSGISELVDGLVQGQTDAILLNNAYLDLLVEMEGYENSIDWIREIHTEKTETIIQNAQTGKKPNWNIKDLFGGNSQEEGNASGDRVFAMYISGIDNRGGLIAKSRSDVNILATVNVDTRQVLLVTTPRDYYVPLALDGEPLDKLTHAGIYGVDVSMGTLEKLYGIEIDYYFRVNFSGFEQIVDALGGITVHNDVAFSAAHGGYYFEEGDIQMDGAAALAFSRERYAFKNEGDRKRGENQMAVIKAVINKAMSPAILTSYAQLMESVAGNFETSMPYDVIAELVRDMLDNGGSWNIVTASVNGSDASRVPYSMNQAVYVMIPNQETVDAVSAKMEQVRNGEILN